MYGGRLIEGDGKHYLLGLVLCVSECGGMYCWGTNLCVCVYEGFMVEGSWREIESIMQWLIDIREIR